MNFCMEGMRNMLPTNDGIGYGAAAERSPNSTTSESELDLHNTAFLEPEEDGNNENDQYDGDNLFNDDNLFDDNNGQLDNNVDLLNTAFLEYRGYNYK